jgi:hypothetical protein
MDDVTGTQDKASGQLRRMNAVYVAVRMPEIVPIAVEQPVEMYHEATGFLVSGRPDAVEATSIVDTKSGRMRRHNGSQYGVYSRQWRSKGHPIATIVEDYTKRAPLSGVQPIPEKIVYDVARSEQQADTILRRIHRDIEDFKFRGEPDAFMANPRSILCSERFCPAFNTAWCVEHRK